MIPIRIAFFTCPGIPLIQVFGAQFLQLGSSPLVLENLFFQTRRAWRPAPSFARDSGARLLLFLFSLFHDQIEQAFPCEGAIACLGARILDGHSQSAGPMPESNCGRNLV